MEALVSLLLQGSRKRVSAGRTEGAASGRRSEDGGRLDRWPVAGGPRAVAPLLALGSSVARFASLAPFSSAFSSPTAATAHSTSSCCCTWPHRPVRRSGFDCCRCSLIVLKLFTFISFLVLVLVHVEETRRKEKGPLLSVSAPSVRKKLKKSSTFFEEASRRLKSLSELGTGFHRLLHRGQPPRLRGTATGARKIKRINHRRHSKYSN